MERNKLFDIVIVVSCLNFFLIVYNIIIGIVYKQHVLSVLGWTMALLYCLSYINIAYYVRKYDKVFDDIIKLVGKYQEISSKLLKELKEKCGQKKK